MMSRLSGSRALPLFGLLAACVATGINSGCESPSGLRVPGPPLEISAEGISPSAVQLRWRPPSQGGTVHHYRIDRATDPGGIWNRVGTSPTTEFLDDGCWAANSTFWYRLQACTAKSTCSDFSTLISAETWPEIPRDLTELTLESLDGKHIWVVWHHWSWDDPQELLRRVDGGSWGTIAEVEGGQFRDFEVEEGRLYGYRVRACNRTGCSEFTPEEEVHLVPLIPPGGCEMGDPVIPRIDDDPFYWYDNEKIPLLPDSTRMMLSATGDDREAVMQSLLEGTGLVAESIETFNTHPDWRRVELGPSTSLAEARSAVEALRKEAALDFVSLGYYSQSFRTLLVNRMVVKFTAEATQQEIACLNASLGMTVEFFPSEHPGPSYWLTYPQGAEPLSFTSFYYLHPLTEWAVTDRVGAGAPAG